MRTISTSQQIVDSEGGFPVHETIMSAKQNTTYSLAHCWMDVLPSHAIKKMVSECKSMTSLQRVIRHVGSQVESQASVEKGGKITRNPATVATHYSNTP